MLTNNEIMKNPGEIIDMTTRSSPTHMSFLLKTESEFKYIVPWAQYDSEEEFNETNNIQTLREYENILLKRLKHVESKIDKVIEEKEYPFNNK